MKVAFYTLGCKLNFSETSTVARQFSERGFEKVEFGSYADVCVINTCSVTDNADRKCRKIVRQALNANPSAFVAIIGCYAQLKPQEIVAIPGVDLVLGAGQKFRLFDFVDDFSKREVGEALAGDIGQVNGFMESFSLGDRTRSFLKIQDGCDYKCSFCTIPLARGKSRSDSLENVLTNARTIAQNGVKEIVLTGVNTGDYGKDQPHDFLDVVQAIDEVEGIERIRISSIEPNLLTNEIIEFTATSKRFMPHFHIPLQSGNDEMLAAMRRRYRRDLYVDRVTRIKELMPHACIGVDVIVGFPGETEAHFLDTYQFLNELDVSYFHVFTYSERANTHALTLPDPVPMQERNKRSKMLRTLSEKKKRYFYNQFVGQTRPVLIEAEKKGDRMFGFTDNYIKVALPVAADQFNSLAQCELTEVDPQGLMVGKLVTPVATV